MGCICSKEFFSRKNDERKVNKSQVTLLGTTKKGENENDLGSLNSISVANNGYSSSFSNRNVDDNNQQQEQKVKTIVIDRPWGSTHHRRATVDYGGQKAVSRIISMPRGAHGEQVVAGWPSWLSSIAGEAIQGWVPLRADSFEKLDKIGQGTYSSVYKAREKESGKMVAMKKVRFMNMDPESVRFMAREILVLRKLDHPNIMKLEGLVASRLSGSLYLVFEYMEHDLAGLSSRPCNKFTLPQIKCYMQQMLRGLVHCHSRGILHRDIKGSNLLINNEGQLKIGDFGLANFFKPGQKEPLTSRVVTLWYRAPELLLGSTDYGVAVDMWSVGCILAELLAGKPIMPGRTEVEQMHKIFKLCGSPSESYWKKTKSSQATSFKPSQPYNRRLMEAFMDFPSPALSLVDALLSIEPEKRGTASSALKSEFFTTHPLPCDPWSLPKFPPTKEIDIKRRSEEARRQKEAVKGRGPESVRRGQRDSKQTPEFDTDDDVNLQEQNESSTYTGDAQRQNNGNGISHSSSMVHPSAAGSSLNKKAKDDSDTHRVQRGRANNIAPRNGHNNNNNSSSNKVVVPHADEADMSYKKHNGNMLKRSKMHYSGPLVPPGGDLDDMLKEHERQIQQAVRKLRTGNNPRKQDKS